MMPNAAIEAVAALQAQADAARTELGRVDTKAAALMGWAGTAFAILTATASVAPLPIAARIAVLAGGALLAAAVTVLLWVIRPALSAQGKSFGFVAHVAARDADELLAALTSDIEARLTTEVTGLSTLTYAKYARLRLAVHLLLAALAILAVALPLGVLG